MKKLFLLVTLFCVSIATSNVGFAASSAASSSTAIEASVTSATLTKSQLKQQKKELRKQRKQERKANFRAWIAKVTGGDNVVLAAVLAFFLGGLGIHRVYMGSKPIIILWYFLTIYGIFGLIPLIDFFRIIFGGTEHYQDRDGLFACFK